MYLPITNTLQWRHKCAWNHLRLNCLCNRLFRRRSKKTWKLRVVSPHKGPVTRKMIPFHDVIMNAMDSCRSETIFWPPIYWPQGQYIIRYFDPFTIFWPPPNSASNSFVCYVQLLRVRSHVRFVRNPHGLLHFWLVTFQQEWSHGVHCGAVRPVNQAKKLPQPRCQKLPQRPLRLKRDSPNTR